MTKKISEIRWTLWALSVFFYFYEFILRVFPSVIVPELMQTFDINASVLGLISAFYLYAYAPMQIPVGFLLDRFSARKLLTFASLICGLGAIGFGFANQVWVLYATRFAMGFGSSFAFLGTIYIAIHWFSETKAVLLIPLANSLGMLGPFFGQGPFEYFAHLYGYRMPIIILGFFGLLLSAFLYFSLRNEPPKMKSLAKKRPSILQILKNSKDVFTHTQSWINALISLLTYLTTVAFAGFWGVPFLQQAHNFNKNLAGFAISMIFIGWISSGPLMGYLTSVKKVSKKLLLIVCSFFAGVILTPIILIPSLPPYIVFGALFLVGFFTTAQVYTYPLAIAHNRPEAKGTTSAFINFMTFLGGCAMQTVIGFLLVYLWNGKTTHHGLPIYSTHSYQILMIGFPISYFLAFILSFFIVEKKTKRPLPY